VPTTISYDNKKFSWGFQTTYSEEVIRGLKLLLDPDQETNYQPSLEAKRLLKRLGKTPGQVTTEYLKELVGHAKGILKRRFGPAADEMDLSFVLTVPAVWSDKAKDITLNAAHLASVPPNKLTLLSEPESAALYALRTIQPNTIKVIIFFNSV
jgi:molecular chaperone DnaK (HSP70)